MIYLRKFSIILSCSIALAGVNAQARPSLPEVRQEAAQPAAGTTIAQPDGTLKVGAQTIGLSQFLSPELRAAYASMINNADWPPPPAMDAPMDVWRKFWQQYDELLRPSYERTLKAYPVAIEATKIGGVPVKVLTPASGISPENSKRVLVHLHGGGFYMGQGPTSASEAIIYSARMRIKVITVDYRMSPQNTFPAASEDVAAVYRELIKQYNPKSIGLLGCSAGGKLSTQSVAWFQTHGLPAPGAIGVFCSGATAPGIGDSSPWDGTGIYRPIAPGSLPPTVYYMRNADLKDPMAYPASSLDVLAKFPPTLFVTGTRSFEMSSAAVTHAKLLKVGVDSQLYIIEGMWHAGYIFAQGTPEAEDVLDYISRWFDKHLVKM